MKKYIAVTMVVAGMLAGVSALAATSITLTPATVSVKVGQTFTVPVSVNPQGVKNYTVGLKLNYPANLLQVKSFTFGNSWMAVGQPGYDLIDNTNGVLIKTAGYPQGFSSNVQFGTVTFQAKKAGTGVIALASGTTAYDQSNQNVFADSAQVNVSIAIASVATPTPTTLTGTVVTPTPSPEASVAAETPSTEPSAQQATLLVTIGSLLSLKTGNWFVALVMILVITYGAYWLIKRKLKK